MPSDKFFSRISTSMGAPALRWAGELNVPIYRLSGWSPNGQGWPRAGPAADHAGRKSGQQRTAPVVYLADGECLSVIGSNAGNARTPAWSLNLKANPDAEVELGRERRTVRARVAEGSERAELWRKHNEQYAGFDDYEARPTAISRSSCWSLS